ncbi:sugar ABC transporter substrate-binding protein [Alicyclobacillus sp. ALC3]|uniref:sugar ABC transporter substrate-binding protein n=1 Tax=Alicyclobacillus sp. ALC3 TaxID=2796143 RepID=UPI00237888E7|nr:sugar ABC transporter substrate-binding protein [Alicyclobacillus sp. ALC3]WDL97693.1 sugar ABC transporter substrate-binding protein [Alicyclobacillus sp. ALC3]
MYKKIGLGVLTVAGLAMLVSGCGNTTSNSSGGGGSSTPGNSASSASGGNSNTSKLLAEYQTQLDAYAQKPKFVANGPAFNAKKIMKGKTILSIPSASTIPFDQNIEVAMQAVAKEVGFNFIEYNNQGQQTQYVQGMNEAVARHVNLIDLLGGPNPSNLLPQMEQAKSAGIPVVTSVLTDPSQPTPPDVKFNIPFQYETVGELLAKWALVHTKGKAHILVITDNQITASQAEEQGIKNIMAQFPQATAVYQDVLNTEWASKIQSITQSELTQNPNINYVIPVFDSMSTYVVPAIDIEHKQNQVNIATFNGTPSILDMVSQGKVQMDLGQSEDWMGRTIIDDEMRLLGGLKVSSNVHIPIYIWTKSNVSQAGVPAQDNQGYGTNYVQDFNKLWGLSK